MHPPVMPLSAQRPDCQARLSFPRITLWIDAQPQRTLRQSSRSGFPTCAPPQPSRHKLEIPTGPQMREVAPVGTVLATAAQKSDKGGSIARLHSLALLTAAGRSGATGGLSRRQKRSSSIWRCTVFHDTRQHRSHLFQQALLSVTGWCNWTSISVIGASPSVPDRWPK